MFSQHQRRQSGFTLMELLVTLLLSTVVLGGLVSAYFSSVNYYRDLQIRAVTNEKARVALEAMAYDIRLMGAGMPISQGNFYAGAPMTIGGGTPALATPTLPILLDATTEQLTIRLNQKGENQVLVDDFYPDVRQDFYVNDDSGLAAGDKVYLSNMTQGKEDGLYGVVISSGSNHVSLNNNWAYSVNAVFQKGSTVNHVSDVKYENASDSIIRTDEHGVATICDNAEFVVEYYNESGAVMALPLTAITVRNNLATIRITVTVSSDHSLSDGTTYEGQASENIMLRNLVLTRLS